jgi:hypothetical protein
LGRPQRYDVQTEFNKYPFFGYARMHKRTDAHGLSHIYTNGFDFDTIKVNGKCVLVIN